MGFVTHQRLDRHQNAPFARPRKTGARLLISSLYLLEKVTIFDFGFLDYSFSLKLNDRKCRKEQCAYLGEKVGRCNALCLTGLTTKIRDRRAGRVV